MPLGRSTPRSIRKVLDELEVPEMYRESVEPKPTGRPRVRPPVTDEEAIKRLCQRLAAGLSMTDACLDPDVPGKTEIYAEMAVNESFRTIIARGREAQQDAFVDDMIPLADSATVENWQVVRLQIWARQWTAARLAPRKYGDRTTIAGDPANPLIVQQAAETRTQLINRLEAMATPEPLTIEGKAEG